MANFQIRTTREQRFEDLFRTMVRDTWNEALKLIDQRNLQPEDYADFEAETRIAIRPFLFTYDTCGAFPECSNEIEGAPLMDLEEHVYLLVLPTTLKEFVDQLCLSAFYCVKHLAKAESKEKLLETIKSSFRQHIASHLYYNPACGRIDACRDAKPVDPWKRGG